MKPNDKIKIARGPHAGKAGRVVDVFDAAELYPGAPLYHKRYKGVRHETKYPPGTKIVQVRLDADQKDRPGLARNFEEADCELRT